MNTTRPPKDLPQLLARRRQARRRRRLLRVDVALGVLIATVTLVIAPGLAVVAVIALVVLAFCAASLVLDRRR
jgi:hypothetical protein